MFSNFRYKLCINSSKSRSGFYYFHQIPFNILKTLIMAEVIAQEKQGGKQKKKHFVSFSSFVIYMLSFESDFDDDQQTFCLQAYTH